MKAFTTDILSESGNRPLIVYGTGVLGELTYYGLKSLGISPDYYCDHAPEETDFYGIKIIHPENLKHYKDGIFLIAFKDYCKRALENLERAGCFEVYHILPLLDSDFSEYPLSHRAMEMLLRRKAYAKMIEHLCTDEPLQIQHVELMVTERCTLRCKDCSALVPFFRNPDDVDLKEFGPSFDRFIESVNFISELSVLGGEPFLNQKLPEFIQKYFDSDKIGMVAFYTNGTIIPNKNYLKMLIHSKVWVHISDYGDFSKNIWKLTELFDEMGVQYFVRRYEDWQNAGDFRERQKSEAELSDQFNKCFKAKCYSFYKGRLYCCSRASSGIAAHVISENPENFIDFTQDETTISKNKLKRSLFKWVNRPYYPVCRYCNGLIDGQCSVKPAVQI